jgi:hypothetical protein
MIARTHIATGRTVGYCSTCAHFTFHDEEVARPGKSRFGRCALDMITIVAACDRYVPKGKPCRVDDQIS